MSDRRRIAVRDGEHTYEVVVPLGVRLGTALDGVGLRLRPETQMLLGRSGGEVSQDAIVDVLDDGAVLAVVDSTETAAATPKLAQSVEGAGSSETVGWWILGAVGVLLAVFFLAGWSPPGRVGIALAAAVIGVLCVVVRAPRSKAAGLASPAALLGPLTLVFAAGTAAIPIAVATPLLLVVSGLVASAILAALAALIAAELTFRSSAAAATVVLVVLALLCTLALLLGMAPGAAAAVTLGAAPVALRALPSMLLDVPPGMFIDFQRFQVNRWTVRERLPEPGGRVTIEGARRIAGTSTSQLLSATVLISVAAAVAAPFALVPLNAAAPLDYWSQLALAIVASAGLLLGVRRTSVPLLRWAPRGVALVIVLTAVMAGFGDMSARGATPSEPVTAAAALLLIGVLACAVLVLVGRGITSLFWSRLADTVEVLCVVLALPTGLVAAGAIDVMRGVMA